MKANLIKKKITVIIKANIYLEDKTRPESYFDIDSPRLFIIEDLIEFLQKYSLNEYKTDSTSFRQNYILPDGRCILNPIGGKISIHPDIRAFSFFKKCKNSVMYINSEESIPSHIKILKISNIQNINKLTDFLQELSHILEEFKDLQKEFLPKSYKDMLCNIKDQLSVAVWFKFEIIFGIYSELFDNLHIFKTLSEILIKDFKDDKVIVAEFRQGYDAEKMRKAG